MSKFCWKGQRVWQSVRIRVRMWSVNFWDPDVQVRVDASLGELVLLRSRRGPELRSTGTILRTNDRNSTSHFWSHCEPRADILSMLKGSGLMPPVVL